MNSLHKTVKFKISHSIDRIPYLVSLKILNKKIIVSALQSIRRPLMSVHYHIHSHSTPKIARGSISTRPWYIRIIPDDIELNYLLHLQLSQTSMMLSQKDARGSVIYRVLSFIPETVDYRWQLRGHTTLYHILTHVALGKSAYTLYIHYYQHSVLCSPFTKGIKSLLTLLNYSHFSVQFIFFLCWLCEHIGTRKDSQ